MKKIVIVGGGFGGVRAALDLHKKLSVKEAEITLLDRHSYHLFLPSLYEVASAFGIQQDPYAVTLRKTVSVPYQDIFQGTKVKFVQAEAACLDFADRAVVTRGEHKFSYDYLVLALGVETDTFNIPGVLEYAYQFKTIDEAIWLNKKITERFTSSRNFPVRLVVVGGGFNGVELAAELACCLENIRKSCGLIRDCVSIKLVEAGSRILPAISDQERATIKKRLSDLGVEVREQAAIKEVGPDFVTMGEERVPSDFTVWTAGVRPPQWLKELQGLPLDPQGKISVNSTMQLSNRPEVFALGDNASFIDPKSQKPVPGLAYVAIDQGKVVAENIKRLVRNKTSLLSYNPFYSVWIAPVGGKFAVAHLKTGLTVSGLRGWLIRSLVDLRYFFSILSVSKALKLFSEDITVFLKND